MNSPNRADMAISRSLLEYNVFCKAPNIPLLINQFPTGSIKPVLM